MIYGHICTYFSKPILDAVLQSYQLRRSNCVILDVTESGIFEKTFELVVDSLYGYSVKLQKIVNKAENTIRPQCLSMF